ncbi:MAG: capsule biosynthesis protein [Pseudomonadota bacterium]
MTDGPAEDGFGGAPYPGSAAAETEATRAKINAGIEQEGLTPRQLRLARRLAQKHAIVAETDLDAVRLLRERGIEPFERKKLLEVVGKPAPVVPGPPLPAPTEAKPVAPPPPANSETRAAEIRAIQRDIARRRRRRIAALILRLAVFVFGPTALAGYYYFVMATPMYATNSEFVIQTADNPASQMGGLLSGTSFATSQDSVTVQGYLNSREAMLRLDADLGFKDHFKSDDIDILRRLEADPTDEEAYKTYRRNVKIGYDPTEGVIKMEVVAADPAASAAFSRALIGYAEEQVDQLTQRLREDQMQGATEIFAAAEDNMEAAQLRVLELQEQLGVLDPASETASIMSQVTSMETQLTEKRLQLQQLLDNPAPNRARVSGVEGDIERLEGMVGNLRAQMTQGDSSATSLARINAQLSMAEVDLQTRTMMMQEALTSLENARVEANRQVRYLSLGVSPIPPDEPTYPRAFENTVVAFLIFSGIYLMLSLTASILREQVSS